MSTDRGCFMESKVCPDRATNGKRNTDEENITPVDSRQNATGEQSEEDPCSAGDHVDAHCEPTLIGRESICQDGSGIGDQEGATYRLYQTENDYLHGGAITGSMNQVEQDRPDSKNPKTHVVHSHPAPHVRDTPE